MSAILSAGRAHVAFSSKSVQRTGIRAVSNGSRVTMSASRPLWLPGSTPPAHLDGSMTGDFGWDPLGLGANPEAMTWFREAELQNGRWAMMGVFGILVQELVKPDVFWYDAPTKIDLPFNIIGIVAFQAFAMHYVEIRRWQDLRKPGSVNKDPIFSNYSLPEHEPGYPGGIFAPFVPGDLEELKLKELKNARLSMLAFVGFVMQAQITGKGPIGCWTDHLADPFGTTIFSKAVVTLGGAVKPACQIPDHVTFQGIDIPTPCFFEGFWP